MPICTEANRFFRRSSAWSRNSGHSDAKLGTGQLADAVGERQRDLRAHGAFRLDQGRWNIHEPCLQIVAVAHDAAKKIHGAPRHIGQPLREHASRAAFRHGNRRAIFRQDSAHDLFQGLAVRRIKMFAEGERHAVNNFIEQLFCLRRVVGPDAGMKLNRRAAKRESWSPCLDKAHKAARRVSRLRILECP